jgi:hypothetical protein
MQTRSAIQKRVFKRENSKPEGSFCFEMEFLQDLASQPPPPPPPSSSLVPIIDAVPEQGTKREWPTVADFSHPAQPDLKRKSPKAGMKIAFKWAGNDVYKFGTNKYLCLYRLPKEELNGMFGEFHFNSSENEWIPDDENIILNGSQLLRFFGLILTGNADTYRPAEMPKGTLSAMHHLGNNNYFVWRNYDRVPMADLCVFVKDDRTGDLQNTTIGISMGIRQYDCLRTSVFDNTLIKKAIEVLQRSLTMNGPAKLPPADLTSLRNSLPVIMFQKWVERLQARCMSCVRLRALFVNPVHRDSSHLCHLGTNFPTMSVEAKNEITGWFNSSQKLKGKKILFKIS